MQYSALTAKAEFLLIFLWVSGAAIADTTGESDSSDNDKASSHRIPIQQFNGNQSATKPGVQGYIGIQFLGIPPRPAFLGAPAAMFDEIPVRVHRV